MIKNKKYELTSDTIFKAFMMDENNRKYKAKIIHLITGIEEERLLEAEYVSEEFPITKKGEKIYRSDIIVRLDPYKKGFINIEMNREYKKSNIRKQNMYKGKLESRILNQGEMYSELRESIVTRFDNYSLYQGDRVLYSFSMRENESYELEDKIYGKYHTNYHIDLIKLRKKRYNKCNQLERLLKMFVEDSNEDQGRMMNCMSEEDANAYAEALDTLKRIEEEHDLIGIYDVEEEEKRDRAELIYETKEEIAINLLNQGVAPEVVASATGMSIDEIENLKTKG